MPALSASALEVRPLIRQIAGCEKNQQCDSRVGLASATIERLPMGRSEHFFELHPLTEGAPSISFGTVQREIGVFHQFFNVRRRRL
jgi:hypothetical protein